MSAIVVRHSRRVHYGLVDTDSSRGSSSRNDQASQQKIIIIILSSLWHGDSSFNKDNLHTCNKIKSIDHFCFVSFPNMPLIIKHGHPCVSPSTKCCPQGYMFVSLAFRLPTASANDTILLHRCFVLIIKVLLRNRYFCLIRSLLGQGQGLPSLCRSSVRVIANHLCIGQSALTTDYFVGRSSLLPR